MLIALGACSQSSDDESPCSSATNVDDAKCTKNIGDIDGQQVNLALNFVDTTFYSPIEKEWKDITADNLRGGIFGQVIPAYSSFLNLTKNAAINIIKESMNQKDNPTSFLEENFSTIPFIEVEANANTNYIYRYKKKELNGQDVASFTGTMEVFENRAFLPLINAMFQGQFYSVNDEVGKRYLHEISISAESADIQGQTPVVIEFESYLQTPVTDFFIDYSDDITDFSLQDRFNFYFDGDDNVPNQNFSFFTLREDDQPEATQSDLRILFKNRPKIVIEQELFFENPIDLDRFKEKGEVSIVRGQNYYVKTVSLDTDTDFNLKIRMNNSLQNLTDGRTFEINNLPAGTPWDLEFIMDLTQNALYNNPQGISLITPYKPTCQEITGIPFAPLAAEAEKETANNSEGFLSICHPQTNQKLFLSKQDKLTTQFDTTDTFFSYFNYIPEDSLRNITGHFNGIRTVTFKMEGCMRVYSRSSGGSGNYELVSKKAEACLDANEQSQGLTGWVYFNAQKTFTINQYLNQYGGTAGLSTLIQSFGNKPVRRTPYFKFNGLTENLEHIY
jgi:hypothetical protein